MGWLSARRRMRRGERMPGEAVVEWAAVDPRGYRGGDGTGGRSRIMHVQHGEVRGATLASGQVLPPGGHRGRH